MDVLMPQHTLTCFLLQWMHTCRSLPQLRTFPGAISSSSITKQTPPLCKLCFEADKVPGGIAAIQKYTLRQCWPVQEATYDSADVVFEL
jgi:hypothetical protein